jgi:chromosomal replication initiation ATPase DnaA
MSAEKFMVEFIRALKENDTIGFKSRLRKRDLLLIDDVQFIAGKDSTQEEFFHTMNEIITAGRRLVITSDRAPQDLDGIAPRILSGCRGGWSPTSTPPITSFASTSSCRSSTRFRACRCSGR